MRNQQINVIDLPPIMVSVDDAAKLLNIKRSRAYELVNRKVIPSIRLGERCVRIPVAALQQWAIQAAGKGEEGRSA